MFRRIITFALLFLVGLSNLAAAQSGGQLCVRSFEDRNGNGRVDGGEPLLTRGVGVNLLDTTGVTIASSLLDTSPTAAQGVVCFQFLPAGQYSVVITSADYTATTPDTITTSITDGGPPTVVEFGAKSVIIPTPAVTPAAEGVNQTALIFALIGGVVVVVLMAFLGLIVYWFAFGRRRAAQMDYRRTTGSIPTVRDTTELQRTRALNEAARETGTSRRVPPPNDTH
ncbi:MAG TPA: SdrD B-like domain-containing protein [Phototrophicaceae bacterium]|nr:SdrD B-like domain-containing protein [Phototrophicaceae bacterium]